MGELNAGPLAGLRVVEASPGMSLVGAGLAACLPGRLFADLGASVTAARAREASTLDVEVEFARVWDRGKVPAPLDDVAALAGDADVLFLSGPEELVERRGLSWRELSRVNPDLVVSRIRPSRNALGALPDLELLVGARAGLFTQIRSHGGGPAFCDLPLAAAGAGLSATVGALACLYERVGTGRGGWAETSLYDGLQALLPMIIGRVEHHSSSTNFLWNGQGPAESLAYACADGGYVQLWFGAKGAYEAFLDHIGDPPSERGYQDELISGAMVGRGRRWASRFATRDRDWWVKDLAGQKFRCEPVLRPGEALRDPHVREIGLAVADGPRTVLGPVVGVRATGPGPADAADRVAPAHIAGALRGGHPVGEDGTRLTRLLEGVRVLDLSAYLAGPITPLVLGELGADVLKVEPVAGDAHRGMEPMFAAGQRGKRAMGLDLKAPGSADVLARLFRASDVVHHNSRVGLAERLGYDEATVRAANPDVVYSFASGFGETGPRAPLPSNDQLMQALAGIEAAQGGAGRPPTYLVWSAVDVTGGWMSACGVLAALYARRRHGGGQSVSSSLLGAALTLKSGAFLEGDTVVSGPVLDGGQTGYGAAYRIYHGSDGAWFALAVPDAPTWQRLRATLALDSLPAGPPPLRGALPLGAPRPPLPTLPDRQPAEPLLERAFRVRPAAHWVGLLRAADVPVEPVVEATRAEFAAGFLDDPVNRERGRIVAYRWGERGLVEQPCFPPRPGPAPPPAPRCGLPGLGEHTAAVLESLAPEQEL